jgi:hypothetical protein
VIALVHTGSCRPDRPAINTAIAHHGAPKMIGAGISTPPLEPFVDAVTAFAERYRA